MPIPDWTRVSAAGFHNFRKDWRIQIFRALNRGVLPAGYAAYTDMPAICWKPGVMNIDSGRTAGPGRQVARAETESDALARKSNRIAVRHEFGRVVAILEVLSPGNKDSRNAISSLLAKTVDFLRRGVNLLIVGLFPSTPRDPAGIHQALWDEISATPFPACPPDKPPTVGGYDTGDGLTAYVDPGGGGSTLPDAPLFLAPGGM
jgi:hypothetical protein